MAKAKRPVRGKTHSPSASPQTPPSIAAATEPQPPDAAPHIEYTGTEFDWPYGYCPHDGPENEIFIRLSCTDGSSAVLSVTKVPYSSDPKRFQRAEHKEFRGVVVERSRDTVVLEFGPGQRARFHPETKQLFLWVGIY